MSLEQTMPARFLAAYQKIKELEQHDRYVGAFIFGSVTRGDHTDQSDVDVKVVVGEDNACRNINHPFVGDVKLDITFISLEQLQASTDEELQKGRRPPMLAGSMIIFDKTGELAALKARADRARPKPFDEHDRQFIQFMIYHANDKAERHVDGDPLTALLVMHISFADVLRMHYQIQERWWLSDKKLLRDLQRWDPRLAALVEAFISTADVQRKFALWSEVIDYVLLPLGGRQPIAENNCDCEQCRADLAHFLLP